MREAGIRTLTMSTRRGGGYWITGSDADFDALVRLVEARAGMNGGEGFDDGLPALRSMRAFLARARKAGQP